MASVWIRSRATKDGNKRYRVEFRLGGRESAELYGGTFRTMREASIRKAWILGELAARRVPSLSALAEEPPAPTLAEAGERWHDARVDVGDSTRTQQYVSLKHALMAFGSRRVDQIRPQEIAELVGELVAKGRNPARFGKRSKRSRWSSITLESLRTRRGTA